MLLTLTIITALCHLNHAARMYSKMESMPQYDAMLKEMQRKSMGHPDPKVGEMVASMRSNSRQNPEEMGTYMGGDIMAPMDMMEDCRKSKNRPRWPNAVVPYTFHENITDEILISQVHKGMREIERHTCVRFVQRGAEKDYVEIWSTHTGCWSPLGRNCGKQPLNLQPGCYNTIGTPMHELMHTLGIDHEQSRKDRDSFVRYLPEHLSSERSGPNFHINENHDGLGAPYDYGSVMHYYLTAFSRDNLRTLEPTTKLGMLSTNVIGQRGILSRFDINKINYLYGCKTETRRYARRRDQ